MLRTKIVCTLGPATSSPEAIQAMVRGGMDMARINMSHGYPEAHKEVIHLVRRFAKVEGKPVAILVDLQGPKIRVGKLAEPVILIQDEEIVFAPEGQERDEELPTTYEDLANDVEAGDRVLLDDGLMELECTGTSGDRAIFRVVRGGILKSNKGINIPEGLLSAPSLTEKDLKDLDFALENRAEFIGLSFVRSKEDVADLKERVQKRALVVAKIEMARALNAIEEIIDESDAVMVARGDLGVELPFERVPMAQKRIIQLANFHGRPVITATQMLESMIEHPRPTRAEASDVANAVLDGTDALMLSGETAVGKYPLEAMGALVSISREIESSGVLERGPRYLMRPNQRYRGGATSREHAIAAATVEAVRQVGAPAIIVITRSGFSARLVSSYRPPVPIFAITTDPMTYRQLTAVWGCRPTLAEEEEVSYESLTNFGKQCLLDLGVGTPGQSVVVTAGYPFHEAGSTNTMRVELL
jgi:pyruvate kinase